MARIDGDFCAVHAAFALLLLAETCSIVQRDCPLPNEPPRRGSRRRINYNRAISGPGYAFDLKDAAARTQAAAERLEQSVSTAALRRMPSAQDVVEVQAFILRREGWNYAEIGKFLDVGSATARILVTEGAKLCVDEEAGTSLRVHWARLDALVREWMPHAFIQPVGEESAQVAQGMGVMPGYFEDAAQTTARRNTELVLKILGMQEAIGTWLAGLPRRGQAPAEDDHAEIKAILLRADEYSDPARPDGSVPHGLPSLADWRPGNVEDEHA